MSQYTYIGTVLDMMETMTNKIQKKLNTFVLHNQIYIKNEVTSSWVGDEVLYGQISQ